MYIRGECERRPGLGFAHTQKINLMPAYHKFQIYLRSLLQQWARHLSSQLLWWALEALCNNKTKPVHFSFDVSSYLFVPWQIFLNIVGVFSTYKCQKSCLHWHQIWCNASLFQIRATLPTKSKVYLAGVLASAVWIHSQGWSRTKEKHLKLHSFCPPGTTLSGNRECWFNVERWIMYMVRSLELEKFLW